MIVSFIMNKFEIYVFKIFVYMNILWLLSLVLIPCFDFVRSDPKDYALKQIEGTGISMSACREIAVSYFLFDSLTKWYLLYKSICNLY